LLKLGWTLNYEMFFYVYFFLCLYFLRARAMYGVFLGFPILILAWWLGLVSYAPWNFWFAPVIFEFCYGALIGLLFLRGWRISPVVAWVLVAGALGLLIVLNPHYSYKLRFLVWGLPSAVFVAALALTKEWHVYKSPFWKGFQIVGEASYTLYLSHPFVISVVYIVWRALFDQGGLFHYTAYTALVLFSAVAYSVVALIVLERPMTRLTGDYLWPRRTKRGSAGDPVGS